MFWTYVRILCVSVIAAAATMSTYSAAPIPRTAESTPFFPTRVGTKWVYETPDGNRTEVITKVEQKKEMKLVTIESVDETGKTNSSRQLSVTNQGVFLVEGTLPAKFEIFRPKKLWLFLPLAPKSQDKWQAETIVEGGCVFGMTTQVVGTERLKTPAGTFNATRVDQAFTTSPFGDGPKQFQNSYWYASGVGLIQVGDPPIWTLKAFIPGK